MGKDAMTLAPATSASLSRVEAEFAWMKAYGWQITEERLMPDGWRVTACLNGIIISEESPSLPQARALVYERVLQG